MISVLISVTPHLYFFLENFITAIYSAFELSLILVKNFLPISFDHDKEMKNNKMRTQKTRVKVYLAALLSNGVKVATKTPSFLIRQYFPKDWI